jgi:hypothetical protein
MPQRAKAPAAASETKPVDAVESAELQPEAAPATPSKAKAKAVDVVKDGQYIRTYSAAVHGEKFAELAEEFASKVEGRKVVPSKA